MNIIFLDIDGVLLTYRPERYFEKIVYGYNLDTVEVFLNLIENAPVPTKIVMISTTMINTDPFKWLNNNPLLKDRFKRYLHKDYDKIERQYLSVNRFKGIEIWIENYGTNINKTIVIDDSIDDYTDTERINKSKLDFYLIPCITAYGMNWVELRLFDLLLRDNLTDVNKSFITSYLEHGFKCDDKDLRQMWNINISPKINI